MQNDNDKLQFELTTLRHEMEAFKEKDGEAVIEAFKASPEFEQL